jgi:photosystem II stability/assembly factor-like uncharacterized protein
MKIILTFILSATFLSSSLYAQGIWQRQSNSPTVRWLKKCVFTDDNYGWATGDSGVIIHTSDGGNTWVAQNSFTVNPIDDIFFLNRRLGWCLTNYAYQTGSYILQTTNSGLNWTIHNYPDTTLVMGAVYFRDSLNGYIGGYQDNFSGVIFKTTNGGINWYKTSMDTGMYAHYIVRNIDFYSDRNGFACGGIFDSRGVMWKTTDYGNNWTSQGVAPEPLFDIAYIDSASAIVSGGDFDFGAATVKSVNGGTRWNYHALMMFGIGWSMAFRTSAQVWMALGFAASWAYSDDSAGTWQHIPGPDSAGIWGVYFVDSLHGWAVGSYGAIYKFIPNAIGIIPLSEAVPSKFNLYQNYPNPFNPITTIKFDVAVKGEGKSYPVGSGQTVKLIIYDVLGREIVKLVNDELKPGSYGVNWDARNYPSGIYFCFMRASSGNTNNYVKTMKMVLTK